MDYLTDMPDEIVAIRRLNNDIWYDLGPHMTCMEADVFYRFLYAIGDGMAATVLMENHAASDEEGDAHFDTKWDAAHF